MNSAGYLYKPISNIFLNYDQRIKAMNFREKGGISKKEPLGVDGKGD